MRNFFIAMILGLTSGQAEADVAWTPGSHLQIGFGGGEACMPWTEVKLRAGQGLVHTQTDFIFSKNGGQCVEKVTKREIALSKKEEVDLVRSLIRAGLWKLRKTSKTAADAPTVDIRGEIGGRKIEAYFPFVDEDPRNYKKLKEIIRLVQEALSEVDAIK